MERYLEETRLLDFGHPSLVTLVESRGWSALPEYERIARIYDFVQNEIAFGYNEADDIPASQVYRDGYGQCNTKGTLPMVLLRPSSGRARTRTSRATASPTTTACSTRPTTSTTGTGPT